MFKWELNVELKWELETKVKAEAHTILAHTIKMVVRKTAHIIYLQTLQNIMDAHNKLHIGVVGHHTGMFRELIEHIIVRILWQSGVVLVSQMSPHTFQRNILAPLQLL